MNAILVIVPSRGRPHNARALIDSWERTTEGRSTLVFGLDDDDETAPDYPRGHCPIVVSSRKKLAAWTNHIARPLLGAYPVLASLGDDHRFATLGWESAILRAMSDMGGTGIAYGDDEVHGEAIPTAFFVTSDIVRALGGMGPPGVQHLFFDDWARELGKAAGCLRYLPDVHTPHIHPLVGKAPQDQTYAEGGSSPTLWSSDRKAFEAWMRDGLEADAAIVRGLRA